MFETLRGWFVDWFMEGPGILLVGVVAVWLFPVVYGIFELLPSIGWHQLLPGMIFITLQAAGVFTFIVVGWIRVKRGW